MVRSEEAKKLQWKRIWKLRDIINLQHHVEDLEKIGRYKDAKLQTEVVKLMIGEVEGMGGYV